MCELYTGVRDMIGKEAMREGLTIHEPMRGSDVLIIYQTLNGGLVFVGNESGIHVAASI